MKTTNKAIMNRIKAIERASPEMGLYLALIERVNGSYRLRCDVGIGGKATNIKRLESVHNSFEGANKRLEELKLQYPTKGDFLLLVDDIEGNEKVLLESPESLKDALHNTSEEDLRAIAEDVPTEAETLDILAKTIKEGNTDD